MQLASIFPGRLIMLDKVKQELVKRRSEALGIENFLNWCKIPIESMPADIAILREYATLKKHRGEGESACMAVARYRKNYIASSNLKDIKDYCQTHSIKFYTTMDVLAEAITTGIMTEAECDHFIQEVTSKNSRLPFYSIKSYFSRTNKILNE